MEYTIIDQLSAPGGPVYTSRDLRSLVPLLWGCTDTADPTLETGVIFIPLLDELVELLSVETWRTLWDYVETRSKRFAQVCNTPSVVRSVWMYERNSCSEPEQLRLCSMTVEQT